MALGLKSRYDIMLKAGSGIYGYEGIMEKKMETTIMGLYRVKGYIGIMEKNMETTIMGLCRVKGYIGIMEKNMEATIWGSG